MTPRQKKGIGFGISAIGLILLAVFNIWFDATPDWVNSLLNAVGAATSTLGIVIVRQAWRD